MVFLKNIFKTLWIGKLFYTIKSLYIYIKSYDFIHDTLYSEDFNGIIEKYLHVKLQKDWIGRLYGVINPNIDIKGNFDISSNIIEIDGQNTNNNEYVKTWIYRQMNMVAQLFKIHKLYEYISMDITHVGPINGDNYLIVFDMVDRQDFTKNLKRLSIHSIIYLILILTLIIIF